MLSSYAPESDILNVLHLGRFIVSKSPSETTDRPQTFIVEMLIIKIIHSRHSYMKQNKALLLGAGGAARAAAYALKEMGFTSITISRSPLSNHIHRCNTNQDVP